MEFYNDLITMYRDDASYHSDIIIRINGRKLAILYMDTDNDNVFTYNHNNVESVLTYLLHLIKLAKQKHIHAAEDIIYKDIHAIIYNKNELDTSDINALNAKIIELKTIIDGDENV